MKILEAPANILADPAKAIPEMSDMISGSAIFTTSAQHLALLRKLRFIQSSGST